MSKITFKIIIYFFIGLGIVLLCTAFYGILNENVIHYKGAVNWVYLKKVADTCMFLAIPWNIAGVFLLYLTLNVQQKQFEKTDSYIRQQQFETTFFNMLNVLTNIKKSIYYEYTSLAQNSLNEIHIKKDQEFFYFALNDLKRLFNNYYNTLDSENQIKIIMEKVKSNTPVNQLERDIIKDDLNEIYLNFYEKYHSNLGHYFRYVFNLMKFAIERRKSDKDEKDYIDLIQAQLTNDELSLIFYNAYSDNGLNRKKDYKFHEWLDKYNFFENLDDRSLLLREHHMLYDRTRFKFLNSDELKLKG